MDTQPGFAPLDASDAVLMGGRTLKQILLNVRVLLEDPSRWSVGCPARDENLQPVKPTDPKAVCWCIEGAVAVCANPWGIIPAAAMRHLDSVARQLLGPDDAHTAGFFNDHIGYLHPRVLEFLDLAIAQAE